MTKVSESTREDCRHARSGSADRDRACWWATRFDCRAATCGTSAPSCTDVTEMAWKRFRGNRKGRPGGRPRASGVRHHGHAGACHWPQTAVRVAMTIRRAPAILNWAGSKARVARFLCRTESPAGPDLSRAVLGSGAAFLALASAGLISKSALSDINPRLVNVFRSVQGKPDDVVSGLRLHSLSGLGRSFLGSLGRLNAQTISTTS